MLKRGGAQLLLSYWPSERGPDFSEKLFVEQTVLALANCGSYKELQWVLDDEMLVRRLRPTAIQGTSLSRDSSTPHTRIRGVPLNTASRPGNTTLPPPTGPAQHVDDMCVVSMQCFETRDLL